MDLIPLAKADSLSLVDQIVSGVRLQIENRQVQPGARLPSIRGFAKSHNLSRFTVVEAYDRLVALGYLRARRGAGFFASAPASVPHPYAPASGNRPNEQQVGLIRRLLEAGDGALLAGGPWLPTEWLEEAGMRRALAAMSRASGAELAEYGNPLGYLPLREHLSLLLGELGIAAPPAQIVLTESTSRALELIIRHLLAPGDVCLVDDPGYYNLFGNLRLSNVRMLAVPRKADGPDVDVLAALAAEHRPKVYFTQSAMQNPTSTDMSPRVIFKVLEAAQRYGFYIVEDDIFSDLQTQGTPRLAAFDQLERVMYVRSFSKTLSGSLRVGFVACSSELAEALVGVKMVTSIVSSQATERLIHSVLMGGQYRKYLSRLKQRLDESRGNVVAAFQRAGLEIFGAPHAGMFVWARFPHVEDASLLNERALRDGILLATGNVFRPYLERSPWMRFNVAVCEDPRVRRWIEATALAR